MQEIVRQLAAKRAVAVMGPEGAVEIILRKDCDNEARFAEDTAEYRQKFANPFVGGHRGYLDDVMLPRYTRKKICRSLAVLKDKRLE